MIAPHARVGQPRRAAIPSLVLYTMGMPGTYHSICVTRGRRSANAAKMVQDDSKSMGQHREVVPVRLLSTGRTLPYWLHEHRYRIEWSHVSVYMYAVTAVPNVVPTRIPEPSQTRACETANWTR